MNIYQLMQGSFITNLTSLGALALYVNVARPSIPLFRAYLQRYVLNQVYFKITLVSSNKSPPTLRPS
jgi:hypothetical protein